MNTGDLMDGRFRLREQLGAGGMAVVWRAHDEVLGRDVALKVLSADLAKDPALLDRIREEARAVARLRHPNVVDVYDYGEVPGPQGRRLPYVVMEVVEGRSLSRLLTAGALPWRLAVLISAQVAAALAAAHERGVVHRDVKPGNVVVGGARVKLVDFGISAVSGDDDRTAGLLLGTPAYLAPERLENGVVRPSTDVYALGLMLYRSLAGRLPWNASTTTEMLIAHRYQEPSALPPIAGLPSEVAALCRQCLDKDPGRRPDATEVATVLAAAAGLSPETLALPGEPAGTGLRADEALARGEGAGVWEDGDLTQARSIGTRPNGALTWARSAGRRDGGAPAASSADLRDGGAPTASSAHLRDGGAPAASSADLQEAGAQAASNAHLRGAGAPAAASSAAAQRDGTLAQAQGTRPDGSGAPGWARAAGLWVGAALKWAKSTGPAEGEAPRWARASGLGREETPTRTALMAGGGVGARVVAARIAAAGRGWRELPRRRRIVVATGAALLLIGPAAAVSLPGSPPGLQADAAVPVTAARIGDRPGCSVGYVVFGTADGRFTTEVSIANTGKEAISAALLTFTLPGEQRLRSGAPGKWRQKGREVSAQVGDLAAGRSRTATFRGTYQAVNALPDRFELNGMTCRAALSVAGATTKTTTTKPAPTRNVAHHGKNAAKDDGPGKAAKDGGPGKAAKDDGPGKAPKKMTEKKDEVDEDEDE